MNSFLRSAIALLTVFSLLFVCAVAEPADGVVTDEQIEATASPEGEQPQDSDAAQQEEQQAPQSAINDPSAAQTVAEKANVVVHWNGTVSYEYTWVLPPMYAGISGIEDMMAGQIEQEFPEYTMEKLEIEGQPGFRLTRTFGKDDKFVVGFAGQEKEVFGALRVKGLLWDTYVLKSYAAPAFSDKVEISLRTPVAARYANAERVNGAYTWTLDNTATEIMPIDVVLILPNLMSIGIILLILIALIILFAAMRSKKRKQDEVEEFVVLDEELEFDAEEADASFEADDQQPEQFEEETEQQDEQE